AAGCRRPPDSATSSGPFVSACHMHIDFNDPQWRDPANYWKIPQCAGAAAFRANLGVDKLMPADLPKAAPTDQVFKTFGEFVEHHTGDKFFAGLANEPEFIADCLR